MLKALRRPSVSGTSSTHVIGSGKCLCENICRGGVQGVWMGTMMHETAGRHPGFPDPDLRVHENVVEEQKPVGRLNHAAVAVQRKVLAVPKNAAVRGAKEFADLGELDPECRRFLLGEAGWGGRGWRGG